MLLEKKLLIMKSILFKSELAAIACTEVGSDWLLAEMVTDGNNVFVDYSVYGSCIFSSAQQTHSEI